MGSFVVYLIDCDASEWGQVLMTRSNQPTASRLPAGIHLALAALLLGFAVFQASPAQARDTYLRVEVQQIIDEHGFVRPVTAGFFLKPVDWSYQGGVGWRKEHSCTWGHATAWQITSADQRHSLAQLPHQRWYYSSDPDPKYARASCGFMPYGKRIVSLEAYLRLRLDALGLNAGNIRYNSYPVPPQMKQLAFDRQTPAGGRQRGWAEVGEVTFTFNGPAGAMEGRLGSMATFQQSVTPPVDMGLGLVRPAVDFGTGYAFFTYLSVAPSGQYDQRLFGTIIRSRQIMPEYNRAILQHNQKLDNQDLKRLWRVGQIMHKNNQEIFDIIQDSWEKKQASMDRDVERFLDVIREVTPYQDSDDPTKQIKAEIRFDSVWKMDDGSYVFGEGRGFDPRRELGLGGVELKPVTGRHSVKDWLQNSLPIE